MYNALQTGSPTPHCNVKKSFAVYTDVCQSVCMHLLRSIKVGGNWSFRDSCYDGYHFSKAGRADRHSVPIVQLIYTYLEELTALQFNRQLPLIVSCTLIHLIDFTENEKWWRFDGYYISLLFFPYLSIVILEYVFLFILNKLCNFT